MNTQTTPLPHSELCRLALAAAGLSSANNFFDDYGWALQATGNSRKHGAFVGYQLEYKTTGHLDTPHIVARFIWRNTTATWTINEDGPKCVDVWNITKAPKVAKS